MKLTLQIKLLPTQEQSDSLVRTIKKCNSACNEISDIAWQNKTFNQFKLHHLVYRKIKDSYNLTAQALVKCISKVSDSYKLDKKRKHHFKPFGAITYDSRILSYKGNTVSIWSVDGRLRISFVCHNPKYLPYIKGEADLVTRKGKFYLFQTVEVPEEDVKDVEEFIGVDFGVIDIATLSDGTNFSSQDLNKVRDKQRRKLKQFTCPRCQKKFYRFRPQIYCSLKCSNKMSNLILDQRVRFPAFPLIPAHAYILGLLLTDGCIIDTPHQSYVQIVLAMSDIKVIEFIRDEISPKSRVHIKSGFASLQIGSKLLVENLKQYGIVPRKSPIAKYPNIPPDLHKYFILGLLDGDGSWSAGIKKDGYKYSSCSFYGTKEMCQNIRDVVFNELGQIFNGPYKDSRKKFLHRICVNSIKRCNKLAQWLYDKHTFGIERKRIVACGNFVDADVNAAQNIAQLGHSCKHARKDVSMLNLHIPLKADCFSCQ